MIGKLFAPAIKAAGKSVTQSSSALGKTVMNHITKHSNKYLAGGITAALTSVAYAVGEALGFKKGKKEGTAEQAARDEKKFKDMHQKHEIDCKRWNKEKQAYEDLLDEIENKL